MAESRDKDDNGIPRTAAKDETSRVLTGSLTGTSLTAGSQNVASPPRVIPASPMSKNAILITGQKKANRSKIPAVEKPGNSMTTSDVQFGDMEFGSNSAAFSVGGNEDDTTDTSRSTSETFVKKPVPFRQSDKHKTNEKYDTYPQKTSKQKTRKRDLDISTNGVSPATNWKQDKGARPKSMPVQKSHIKQSTFLKEKRWANKPGRPERETEMRNRQSKLLHTPTQSKEHDNGRKWKEDMVRIERKRFKETALLQSDNSNNWSRGSPSNISSESGKSINCDSQINTSRTCVDTGKMNDRARTSMYVGKVRNSDMDNCHRDGQLDTRDAYEAHSRGDTNGCRTKQTTCQGNGIFQNLNYNKHDQDQYDSTRKENQKRANKVLGFPFLKNLIGKDSGYIILQLTKFASSLKDCISRTAKEKEFLELFLQVLAEGYSSKTTPNLMIELFDALKDEHFFNTVMLYLIDSMVKINAGEIDRHRVGQVLVNMLSIIMEQITRNPSSIFVFSRIHTIIGQVIESLLKCSAVDDIIVSTYEDLTEQKKKIDKMQNSSSGRKETQPPDDFRQYPVVPDPSEITGTIRPFLRSNKVEGGYDDLDHYLDVQFRLLREDFIGPLREGLTDYIKLTMLKNQSNRNVKSVKRLDIKIYENVRVQTPVVTDHGLCYKLQLEMNTRLKRTNFSKRLIYGSLVCLTDNEFNSFFLATVVERDEADIKNGFCIVHFENENLTTHDLLHKVFRMAETSAYFESYRHILTSLQAINNGDLPFEKYIVRCDKRVDPPAYLNPNRTYDLRPLVDQQMVLQSERRLQNIRPDIRTSSNSSFSHKSHEAQEVCVLDKDTWPSKELLNLDESQYKAVQSALTNEFAIIQGPPGTGKTYIGLQIVKALLHNRSAWERSGNEIRPMLVVCYTNHALDQFLEGIVEFFNGDVLRVGGRSDSTVLKNCNLKYYRQIHQPPRTQLGQLQHIRKQARQDLMEQSDNLQELAKCIEVYNTEIVDENYLKYEMGLLFNDLVNGYKGKKRGKIRSYMVTWLAIGRLQLMCRRQVQNTDESNEEQYVKVENDTSQKRRNMIVDTGEDVIERIERKEKELLRRIRNKVGIAFFIPKETQNSQTKEIDKEAKFNRVLRATIERKISDHDIMSQEEANHIHGIWRLSHEARWRLYRLWIQKLCVKEYNKIEARRSEFEVASERYREAILQEDKEIMKQASVIGITTSGAARYQSVLRTICPRIIVIEEAAEVLEAHIVTTLSKGCEHLILIGDHKQLKPNPTVYRLAVKYNLDLSLFERMIKNGMKFNCLELQHRMRPEISSIMKHIYSDLQDHEHVMAYPDVKGISTNVYFINHDNPENTNEDIRSYSNSLEAQFAVALCRYLSLQGYQKREITILTTYSGQLMCMRKFMPRDEFQDVKLTVVDNYQGEENTIVILSLVRSNNDDKIGFLKTENRICVALSRAKVGFYVLGNFDHLAAHSSLWKKITDEMKDKGTFGNGLKIYCQNHPQDEPIVAVKHGDFNNAPEGGCRKYCDIRLECGHKCVRYCHILDRKHETNVCREPCTKSCDRGHRCPDKCFVKCLCKTPMQKTIESCGHVQTVRCSVETCNFSCRAHCEQILKCGHGCKNACGDTHTSRCIKDVSFTWPCGHSATIKCWKVGVEECPHPCETVLKCEHICSGTCGSCFKGRVHQPCLHDCKRLLVCGHECKDYCNNCPPCTEQCLNRCVHSVCNKTCGEGCVPCQEPCSWKCRHYKCTKRCSEPCNRPRCNEACKTLLEKCGHQCIGLCGEPCPILCRKCDKEKVTEIFFGDEDMPNARFVLLEDCSHMFESMAMDKYMHMDDEDTTIQLKSCPLCKTPIRKCLRYGRIINRALDDIERVKKEMVGDDKRFKIVRSKVQKMVDSLCCGESAKSRNVRYLRSVRLEMVNCHIQPNPEKLMCQQEIEGMLRRLEKRGIYSERQLVTIENQQIIAEAIIDIRRGIVNDTHTSTQLKQEKDMLSFFHDLLCCILKDREFMSEQEIDDYKNEVQRGRVYAKYLKVVKTKSTIQDDGKAKEAKMITKKIQSIAFMTERFTDEMEREINDCIERIKELLKIDGMGITEDERLEIVKAVGLRKGHWFKCPNNHIYAIGDCGGANQKSTCPECKVEIGGLQHRLSDGNKLASEMDGAPFAAYSEEANNMGNFDLNNLL